MAYRIGCLAQRMLISGDETRTAYCWQENEVLFSLYSCMSALYTSWSIQTIPAHQVELIKHHHHGLEEQWAKDDNPVSAGLANCDHAGGGHFNRGQDENQDSSISIILSWQAF